MLYFKHEDGLYSKYDAETGELSHMSVFNQDYCATVQKIDESQRSIIQSNLESNSTPVDQSEFEAFIASIKAKIAQV